MSLSPRQAFKTGFLLWCAQQGLTPDQTDHHVKQAGFWTSLLSLGVGLPIVGAIGAGSAAGYGAAKLTEPEVSPADAKVQEVVATYNQMADRLRRAAYRRRKMMAAGAPRSPRLM